MSAAPSHDASLTASAHFAELLPAYLNSPEDMQAAVRQLAALYNDPKSPPEARRQARALIAENLGLLPGGRAQGIDLDVLARPVTPAARALDDRLDREEEHFARRLLERLRERGMTQNDLAQALAVAPSAVSMMLARRCRPQRRTVLKVAQVLDCDPGDLWPAFNA